MGRLRDDSECNLFRGVSEEVVDLFGIDGVRLFRHDPADNVTNRDPLWDEPHEITGPGQTGHVRFKEFEIKAMFLDYHDQPEPGPDGLPQYYENKIYVALAHLEKAGVRPDGENEFIAEGDMIFLFNGKKEFFYDIVNVDRVGWINDTSQFTGYELDVKRNTKFVPERKIS